MRPADTTAEPWGDSRRSASALGLRLAHLPDGHPSSPRYPPDGRIATDIRPLTDAEHAEHVADVRARLAGARAAGLDTRFGHTLDRAHEIWSDDRDAAHDRLLGDLYARAVPVPCEHRAVVAGGLPGAGKTTVLTREAGLDLAGFLVINPDLIKEEMSRRRLVPEVHGLSPMEASALAHEEASYIAKRLAHRAQADGKNVVWDVTMSKTETCFHRVAALRAAGYTQIDGVFVDIPIAVSLSRADARHRQGHDDFRAGIGLGGRFTPREMILAQAEASWGSVNRANFELVTGLFDAWSRYDNSADGRAARLAARGGRDLGNTR